MPLCWTEFIFHWLKSMRRAKSTNSANLNRDIVLVLTSQMAWVTAGGHMLEPGQLNGRHHAGRGRTGNQNRFQIFPHVCPPALRSLSGQSLQCHAYFKCKWIHQRAPLHLRLAIALQYSKEGVSLPKPDSYSCPGGVSLPPELRPWRTPLMAFNRSLS
jgi:hypothetical protein